MELKTQALEDNTSLAAEYFLSQNIDVEQFNPEPFGMLDFSPVGGIIAILGVLFVVLIGWRFIPKGSYKKPGTESLFSIDVYITEIRIPKGCKFISKKISEIEKYTEDRIVIIACISKNGNILTPRHGQIIGEGDRFQIQADPVDLKLMMDEYGLRLTKKMRARIDQNSSVQFSGQGGTDQNSSVFWPGRNGSEQFRSVFWPGRTGSEERSFLARAERVRTAPSCSQAEEEPIRTAQF